LELQDAIHVVGLTCRGEVPLLRIGSRTGETIALPGVIAAGKQGEEDREDEGLQSVNRMLAAFGYRAAELVTLSRYGIPTGEMGRSSLLLAPLLARAEGRLAVAPSRLAVEEVPIAMADEWLRERKAAGARVDPKVWVGLLLTRRYFPGWARQRLRASLLGLERRGFSRGLVQDTRSDNAEAGARGA
jgi:hypothetical protein